MKTKITSLIAIAILTMLSYTSYSQTNVSGGIFANTTWTLAGSPYIVTDTVVVMPGLTLTIQPGVVVKFNSDGELEIRQSSIIANGTSADSITFTSNSGSPYLGIWSGIKLNQSTSAQFNYCNLFYAFNGIQTFSNTLTVIFKNSTCSNNFSGFYAIHGLADSCLFKNNTNPVSIGGGHLNYSVISHNQNGLNYNNITPFPITNCTFTDNQTAVTGSYFNLTNCVVDSNSSYGLVTSGGSAINCKFRYNGTGLVISGGGSLVTQNVIEHNSIGVECPGATNIYCNKICNNTLYDFKNTGTGNLSAANNYWCTNDSTSTAAVIYDAHDNVSIGIVTFMPLDATNCYLSGCNLSISASIVNATCATCPNGSAMATVMNGFAPYTYTWYSAPIQTTQTATGLPSGLYAICVTDANGCSTCDSVFVDSTNCTGFSVTTSSTNATCSSCNDGTAMATPTGGSGPYNYTWYTIPMQATASISSLGQGTYGVCITDVNGCTVCDSATIGIGNCSAHFSLYADTIPQNYIAINMASGALPLTYLWSWGDGTYDSTAYPSHTYSTSGFYTICLTITDFVGCTNTYCSSYYLLMPQSPMVHVSVYPPGGTSVGINNKAKEESITISPNPFTSQTTITFNSEQKSTAIKITDVLGKEIKSINFSGKQCIIDKGEMCEGIYFVQIMNFDRLNMTNHVVNRKIVIQ